MKKTIIILLCVIVSLIAIPFIIGLIMAFSMAIKSNGMTFKDFVFPIVMLCFAGLCVVMAIYTSRGKRRRKKEIERMKVEEGLICNLYLKHTAGLPIMEGLNCDIFCFKDKIEIKYNEMKFNLDRERVRDVCLKTDIDIQKQYVSSSGGAIAGGLLFGPVGALIGGRTKQKKIKNVSTYLIITYTNDDEIKYVGFDATNSTLQANKFVKEFGKSNSNNQAAIVDL